MVLEVPSLTRHVREPKCWTQGVLGANRIIDGQWNVKRRAELPAALEVGGLLPEPFLTRVVPDGVGVHRIHRALEIVSGLLTQILNREHHAPDDVRTCDIHDGILRRQASRRHLDPAGLRAVRAVDEVLLEVMFWSSW